MHRQINDSRSLNPMSSDVASPNKRARTHNQPQDADETHTQAYNLSNNRNGFVRCPFMVPLLTQYLADFDVLCILLLIARSMQRYLSGYQVKQPVSYDIYETIVSTSRYLSVRIDKVKDVTELPLNTSQPIRYVEMHNQFDQPIPPNALPNTLIQLDFPPDSYFKQPFDIGALPQSLTSLRLDNCFRHKIPTNVLPLSLTSLVVGCYDRVLLSAGPLLINLKSLVVLSTFLSDPIPGTLPPNLEILESGFAMASYSLRLGVFPSSLKRLKVHNYHHSLDPDVLPVGLACLTLCDFVKPIVVGVFPHTLVELNIQGRTITDFVVGVLPQSLKRLSVVFSPGSKLSPAGVVYFEPGAIPADLEQLSMGRFWENPCSRDLNWEGTRQPLKDSEMFSSNNVSWDPMAVKAVVPHWLVGCHLLDLSLTINPSQLVAGVFPRSLRRLHLMIRPDVDDDVDDSKLEYSGWTATPFAVTLLPGVIPPAVNNLKLQWYYSRNYCLVSGSLPESVRLVMLYNCVPSPNFLPNSVTHLQVGQCFWNQLIDVLARVPGSVTQLTLCEYLCPNPKAQVQPVEIDHEYRDNDKFRPQCIIPISVTHLHIDACYDRFVQFLKFPPHLVQLHVGQSLRKYPEL